MALLKFHLWSINTASLKNQSFFDKIPRNKATIFEERGGRDVWWYVEIRVIWILENFEFWKIIIFWKNSKEQSHNVWGKGKERRLVFVEIRVILILNNFEFWKIHHFLIKFQETKPQILEDSLNKMICNFWTKHIFKNVLFLYNTKWRFSSNFKIKVVLDFAL